MRKLALLLFPILLFLSCDNELDAIEDPKDIPIIYGVMSLSDTAQYIRIERAFIDPMTSALVLAMNPDSLYYSDIDVSIVSSNGQQVSLTRVNGNDEGFPREEGAFPQDPNYLYKVKSSELNLNENDVYTLEVQRPNELPLVTAQTNLVGESKFIVPIAVAGNQPKLDFNYVNPTRIKWREGANASLYDVSLLINISESQNGQDLTKQLKWTIANGVETNEINKDGQDFYAFIAGALEKNSGISRKFQGIDILIEGGNSELLEFLRISQANLGITSTQDIPNYTNLSEGRGIFASKYSNYLYGVDLSLVSFDSLKNGQLTRELNFE